MNSTVPPPILITGCGRSGASMIAGVIRICGAFEGNVGGDNKHYENLRVRDEIVRPFLVELGKDPMGQYPVPDPKNINIPTNWADRVISSMRADGYTGGPWAIKGSYLALTWPVWHYAFPQAKWIIVRRRTGDIVQSCLKTDFMRAFRSEANRRAVGAGDELAGWIWWVREHEQRFVEMIVEGLNCKVIWPERMVWGDYQQMFETIDWLGLKWTSEALAYIDPKLWKARRSAASRKSL